MATWPVEAVWEAVFPLLPGFTVEVAAAEPDIVNPIAMAFDEKGRIWVTESFEYPRREAGPGRDRVKVLEDTDGDGRYEKVTIFAEGLNIPSGIAVPVFPQMTSRVVSPEDRVAGAVRLPHGQVEAIRQRNPDGLTGQGRHDTCDE